MTRFDHKDPRAVPRYAQELVLGEFQPGDDSMDGEGMHNFWRVQISGTIQTVACILVLLFPNTTAAHANGYIYCI